MKFRILFGAAMMVASVAVATGLVGPTAIASAHPSNAWPRAYTCTGGDFASGNLTSIPSGIYANITVKGACAVAPDAVITVLGNVNVAPGAVLDAQSAPSTITVRHDVTAGPGSLLGLGCLPNPVGHTTGHPCTVDPTGSSNITVNGNVVTTGAYFVALRGITVRGSVALIGGGEHTTDGSNNWPIKLDTIGGNVIVHGATPDWVGVVANTISGNVILTNITIDTGPTPPAENINVGSNTIGGNLICFGLAPAVNGGFGAPNVIGGKAIGQCANL
jgi:hypothetical protein